MVQSKVFVYASVALIDIRLGFVKNVSIAEIQSNQINHSLEFKRSQLLFTMFRYIYIWIHACATDEYVCVCVRDFKRSPKYNRQTLAKSKQKE